MKPVIQPVGALCRATRGEATPRLVLVTGNCDDSSHGSLLRVRLLSNEVEMATSDDADVPGSRSGRPYDLIAHDFPGYVLASDLGDPVALVDLSQRLRRCQSPPLTRRTDPRWAWKLSELEALQALQPPLSVILGEHPD